MPTTTSRDYDRAIQDYNQALKINPNYALAYYDRGVVYYDRQRLRPRGRRSEQGDRARSEGFARLLQPRPDLSRQGRDGQGAGRLRPVDQARSEEPAAVSTTAASPLATRANWSAPSPTSASRSGWTRATRWRSTTAAWPIGTAARPTGGADYEQAIRINPGYAPTYYSRGLASIEKRDYDRAILDLNQAINGRPNYPLAFNMRGMAYIAQGRDRPRHPGLRPGDPARCASSRSHSTTAARPILGKRDLDRAIADFDQAIKANPNYDTAYYNRGLALPRQARLRARGGRFRPGHQAQSEERGGLNNRGFAYWNIGDNDAAIADFEQAIKLDPKFAAAYTNRGTALLRQARLRPRHRRLRSGDQVQPEHARQPGTIAASPIRDKGDNDRAIRISIRRSSSIPSSRRPSPAAASPTATSATTPAPSPISTARSGSMPSSPAPTTTAAWSTPRPASPTAPSPTSPRRSGSIRTTTSPTTTAA